jgi:hypothetical protein
MKTAEGRWKKYLPNHDERVMRGFQAKKEVKLGNVCGFVFVCGSDDLCRDHLKSRASVKIRLFAAILLFSTLTALASALAADAPGAAIPPKHQVVVIPVDSADESIMFLVPGSRVDVVANRKLPNGKIEAKLLVRNSLVVAVDIQLDPKDRAKIVSQSISVAAPANEARLVKAEMKAGKVTLMPRKGGDAASPTK